MGYSLDRRPSLRPAAFAPLALLYAATIALFVFCLCGGPAFAQGIAAPPRHDSRSATGVSFRGGGFSLSEEDLSIGGGLPTGLSLVRSYNSATDGISDPYLAAVGWTHSLNIYIAQQALPQEPEFATSPNYHGRCVYNVVGGSSATGFVNYAAVHPQQLQGCVATITGPYVPITPSGDSLVYLTTPSGHYQYTGADGSVINFTPGQGGKASDWTMPDGTRLDFTYASGAIKSVFSNRGWAILFESQYKICAVNLAETYVTSTSTCPSDAQAVTYAYTSGTYVTSWNLMTTATKAGSTRSYSYADNDHVNCIKDPGQTTCRIQNTYSHCPEDIYLSMPQPSVRLHDPVVSQQDGSGRTFAYSYAADSCPQWSVITDPDYRPFEPNTTTVTESGVPGSSIAVTDTASQLLTLTDPLGRSSNFGYLGSVDYLYESGSQESVELPEGNQEYVSRDSRGNIISKTIAAKSGSGLSDLVWTASYPSTCTNVFTCNKPTSVTDPKGQTTDYTYDSSHGGTLTETLPADANGVRTVKRHSYAQRYAWIKNSGGGYSQAATPVWVPTEERICNTSATSGGACAAGSSDETVTSFDYGPNSGPNNLLLRGQTIASNGVTLRTCYSYDRDGRRISETKPNAGLGSCP